VGVVGALLTGVGGGVGVSSPPLPPQDHKTEINANIYSVFFIVILL
jgi:hypothetical protein